MQRSFASICAEWNPVSLFHFSSFYSSFSPMSFPRPSFSSLFLSSSSFSLLASDLAVGVAVPSFSSSFLPYSSFCLLACDHAVGVAAPSFSSSYSFPLLASDHAVGVAHLPTPLPSCLPLSFPCWQAITLWVWQLLRPAVWKRTVWTRLIFRRRLRWRFSFASGLFWAFAAI